MTVTSKKYWTALLAIDGIGKATFRKIQKMRAERTLTWAECWSSLLRHPQRWFLTSLQLENLLHFGQKYTPDSYWEYLQQENIQVVTEHDAHFPPLLVPLEDRPPLLFVKGKLPDWSAPVIAVVGTRHMTGYGQYVTDKVTSELAKLGAVIISGFMYGVDVCAHKAAHAAGGKTVGVLGFGFEHLYPSSQSGLFQELLAQGQSFLSEYAPHVVGNKGSFPTRNRLIAGMSLGVIVAEAGLKSGSHITVQFALEYGRNVYAIPGPITNPYADGTKALINEGALCIGSGQEVLADLGWQITNLPTQNSFQIDTANALSERVYSMLASAPQTLDQLQIAVSSDVSQVLTALTFLELQGAVRKDGETWCVIK